MDNWTRRNFIRTALPAGVGVTLVPKNSGGFFNMAETKKITITETDSNFEREPLIRPFGFKGGFLSEIWQTVSYLKSASGISKAGLGTQSVLWSDARTFEEYSENGGNALMYAMTDYALKLLKNVSFDSPVNLLDEILDKVYEYGKAITKNPNLRKTFALNALVGVDNAAWMLYAAENNFSTFDDMIPDTYKMAVSNHHKTVASMPLIAYSDSVSEIEKMISHGYFYLKIKLGQPGTQEEMLEKDKARLTEIHKRIGHHTTDHTVDGKIPYFFDANGRYEKKETLLKFIDHAQKIGALEQIAIIEEPFREHLEIDVSDIPLRLAADESAHTDEDALKRIQMGYTAIALKAVAKTLSMTLKIAKVARERRIPCFCADLTVNPILLDWNKSIAARVDSFPGLTGGLMEANGHQNYKYWEQMETYHPYPKASWQQVQDGVYNLGDDFYQKSAGVLLNSEHYSKLVGKS